MRELFPGQQDDEKICLVVREHWFMFFFRFLAWMLFVAILFLADWAISTYMPGLKTNYPDWVNLLRNIYLMFLTLGLLIMWTLYYLNVQIITNERVVDILQVSLLNRKVSELHLSRIEDVTAEVKGVFGTFFNFGNVYIQTAGETERFVFNNVPNPAAIEKMLLDMYEELPENKKEHKEPLKK